MLKRFKIKGLKGILSLFLRDRLQIWLLILSEFEWIN